MLGVAPIASKTVRMRISASNSHAAALLALALCLLDTASARPHIATARRSLLDNGLGLTPPMGWNSWNHFHCQINETLIQETADALISSGLAMLGYNYVNLDDCWALSNRDFWGNLVPDPTKFPSGMDNLATYMHSRGLKLGIYSSAGTRTCSGTMPGSLGHELQDAITFAIWEVDYLKYDNCYNNDISPIQRYSTMSLALKVTGHPIFYNICEWGDEDPASWAPAIGNSWRTTDDITDNFGSMLQIADINEFYADQAKPGAWNDPDMLEVGNDGMSYEQYKVHFSLWAISKAPLLIGCDVRNMSPETKSILGNIEVIAVNQDPLGVQAKKVRNFGDRDIWAGPLCGSRVALLFVNRKPIVEPMTALWSDISLLGFVTVQARDLWKHETLSTTFQGNISTTVQPQSCMMFVLTPIL